MKTKPQENKKHILRNIIIVCLVLLAIWFYFGGGLESVANNKMQKIENKVAVDAEKEYYIAKRQGDKMQVYTQASFVAAAYLQAKDEPNYNKWKAIQDSCAATVGLTQ